MADVSFEWNDDDRTATATSEDRSLTVVVDQLGQLESATRSNGAASAFTYHDNGSVASATTSEGGVVVSVDSFNSYGALTKREHRVDEGRDLNTVEQHTYHADGAGMLSSSQSYTTEGTLTTAYTYSDAVRHPRLLPGVPAPRPRRCRSSPPRRARRTRPGWCGSAKKPPSRWVASSGCAS